MKTNFIDYDERANIWARIRELEYERSTYVSRFPEAYREVRDQHWSECTEDGEELNRLRALVNAD